MQIYLSWRNEFGLVSKTAKATVARQMPGKIQGFCATENVR
jgi:hypothetical protein